MTAPEETKPITEQEVYEDYRKALVMLDQQISENELLRESVEDVYRQYDTKGWEKINGYETDGTLTLRVCQEWAKENRQLLLNPLIKRGIRIRVSYVFGEGLIIDGAKTGQKAKFIKDNAKTLFSSQAYAELETALATDGQFFLLLERATKTVIRVPLSEITNVMVKSNDKEKVLFIQRTWREDKTQFNSEITSTVTEAKKMWYPVIDLDPKIKTKAGRKIAGVDVDYTCAMMHISVNKQIGWVYGIPDIQSVVFWVKAYKEYLENNYTLVRALAAFAFKVMNSTQQSQKRAGVKLAGATPIDPNTGRLATTGHSVNLEPGQDLVAVNKAGAHVDFKAGQPLAAMIASGMDVNLVHLLSDPSIGQYGSADVMDVPQLKSMATRQEVYKAAFTDVMEYFGVKGITLTFPPIQSEALLRVIQAIVQAASTNTLHEEEIRDIIILALRPYGIDPKPVIPKPGQYAGFVSGIDPQEQFQATQDMAKAALDAKANGTDPNGNGTGATGNGKVNKNPGTTPIKNPKGAAVGSKGRSATGPAHTGDKTLRKSQGTKS